jgi:membrane-bound acyltransferase YfiQ involved in biofilm formation
MMEHLAHLDYQVMMEHLAHQAKKVTKVILEMMGHLVMVARVKRETQDKAFPQAAVLAKFLLKSTAMTITQNG